MPKFPISKQKLEELSGALGFNTPTEFREEIKDELLLEEGDLENKHGEGTDAFKKAKNTYLKGTSVSSIDGWFSGAIQPNRQPFSIAVKRVFKASKRDCDIKKESDLEPFIKAITQKTTQKIKTTEAEKTKKTDLDTKPPKIQTSKLPHTNSHLFGREDELVLLNEAWDNIQTNILILKAFGGTGKTALMKKWLDSFPLNNFRGANAIYTWSFYSQGSAEDKQASADIFFNDALGWFGYKGDPLPSARDKALKLAELISQQRTLLLLDGLEPLQYPEGGVMDGALRDEGLKVLFEQLAMQNKGLLLISSRQLIKELEGKPEPLIIQHELDPLSVEAGTELFKAAKIIGTAKEFKKAVNEVNGHALSLNLLAQYLSTYEDSDIRQRKNLKALADFPEENRDTQHAFKVMAAYEKQLQGTTELQILYMLGLFDRPVSAGAIHYLRQATIAHISDIQINDQVFKAVIQRLRKQNLLNKENPEHPDTLDAHPLVREYFGKRLKQQYPLNWQHAHSALYNYFKEIPENPQPDTLGEMEPLFSAIAHGCAAGLHQEALDEVYWPRILREDDHYIAKKLGAFGADLSVLSHFFESSFKTSQTDQSVTMGWQTPAVGLSDNAKASLLNWAAFRLRALGRLQEALQPMQAGLKMQIKQKDWENAASSASSISELQLTRGRILQGIDLLIKASTTNEPSAIEAAKQSVELAVLNKKQNSGTAWQQEKFCATILADAQHQAGDLATAHQLFVETEELQKEWQPEFPQLYSMSGYRYCDLLLTTGEWREVQQRAEQTLEWAEYQGALLLEIPLDQLSLGRASLQQVIEKTFAKGTNKTKDYFSCVFVPFMDKKIKLANLKTDKDWLNQAVNGLRKAGTEHHVPRGLLVRANYYRWCLSLCDLDKTTLQKTYQNALNDLNETYNMAQRSGMLLFLTDYHLESARLALVVELLVEQGHSFPKDPNLPSPISQEREQQPSIDEHIAEAKALIDKTGYGRRLPELEYLEGFIQK